MRAGISGCGILTAIAIVLAPKAAISSASSASANAFASILVYHRFGPVAADSMTIRTATFRAQLQYLKTHHYVVVPLRAVVDGLLENRMPPEHAVAITADDGHRSVFTDMLPVVREYGVPVALFIYPSAISNASYAMTWDELRALRDTGLFDIQSHTYWHPNFNIEKRRLAADAYRAFATMQLCKPIAVLEAKLGVRPNLVAWPFGIYNDELFRIAEECGYRAGFTLHAHPARAREQIMALPRFLVTDTASAARFAAMLP
jgi:peptidoglycan/xylan/chitin deacetylase (PgdA/CDA1 family)